MNKNFTDARIKAEKEKIIKMYKDDIPILDIAKEYGVISTSILRHLRNWGIKTKRKSYNYREKKIKLVKRIFSPELKTKMAENTRINNKYVKFFKTVETTKDRFMVNNILKGSEANNGKH